MQCKNSETGEQETRAVSVSPDTKYMFTRWLYGEDTPNTKRPHECHVDQPAEMQQPPAAQLVAVFNLDTDAKNASGDGGQASGSGVAQASGNGGRAVPGDWGAQGDPGAQASGVEMPQTSRRAAAAGPSSGDGSRFEEDDTLRMLENYPQLNMTRKFYDPMNPRPRRPTFSQERSRVDGLTRQMRQVTLADPRAPPDAPPHAEAESPEGARYSGRDGAPTVRVSVRAAAARRRGPPRARSAAIPVPEPGARAHHNRLPVPFGEQQRHREGRMTYAARPVIPKSYKKN